MEIMFSILLENTVTKYFLRAVCLNNGTEYNLFIITAYNDGIQKELFTLDGTIPVKFRGTYNE